jgi:carbamoyltransferase
MDKSNTIYIGLNDNFHDPSICFLNSEGKIVFAESVERPLQYKRGIGCPPDLDFYIEKIIAEHFTDTTQKIIIASSWSKYRHLSSNLLDFIGFFNYDSKSIFRKILQKGGTHRSFHYGSLRAAAALSQSGAGVFKIFNKINPNSIITREYYNHHLSHIANAISCTNNISDGIGLVIDGGGEGTAISIYNIENNSPILVKTIPTNFSLGSLYSIVTNAIGYSAHKGEEWKVMGLAPYGKKSLQLENCLKDIFRIDNNKYTTKSIILGKYEYIIQKLIINEKISKEDAAYTLQQLFYEYLVDIIKYAKKLVPDKSDIFICGGSALNSSAMGQISESGLFENVVIPNAPADDGNAIGAAVLSFAKNTGVFPKPDYFRSPYNGSEINRTIIEKYIKTSQLPFVKLENAPKYAAELLHQNKIIGWIQGKAEFGPRALGNRSILAHPGFAENKNRINNVVKFREEFRPFAPSILHEFGNQYFKNYSFTPYMEKSLVYKSEVINSIPAAVHINNTGRLQSVTKELNTRFYQLIYEFNLLSGLPVVINTSYNVMGKPIVHDINDVMAVFLNSSLDAVIIDDFIIERK